MNVKPRYVNPAYNVVSLEFRKVFLICLNRKVMLRKTGSCNALKTLLPLLLQQFVHNVGHWCIEPCKMPTTSYLRLLKALGNLVLNLPLKFSWDKFERYGRETENSRKHIVVAQICKYYNRYESK